MRKSVQGGVINVTRRSPEEWMSLAATVFSVFLIVLGVFGLYLVQTSIEQPQDLRQQASVEQGQVTVTVSGPSQLTAGTAATLTINANTNNLATDGIQLFFNVVTDTLDAPPSFDLVPNKGLQLAYSEIEETTDGYLVAVIMLPAQIGQTFSSNQNDYSIATMSFTPQQAGSITLNFDREQSISTAHDSNPPRDELTHIDSYTFMVIDDAQATPSPSPSPSPTPSVSPDVSPSPSPSPTPSVSPDVSPSPSVSPAVSPSPSVSPAVSPSPSDDGSGTGGNTVKSCNESCSSNDECAINHRCYDNRCRLVTNVSSTSCENPADQGLNRSCNEYCADSRECGGDYTCWNNRCRNPYNVENESCAQLTQVQYQQYVSSCNQTCSTNNDCSTNLRCYQGRCRLATNVGSSSCSAAKTQTVSVAYTKPKNTTPKGGDFMSPTGSPSSSPVASGSPKASTSPFSSAKPSASPLAPTYTDTSSDETGDETALEALTRNLKERGAGFPLAMIGSGLFLILLILFLLAMSRRKDSSPRPPTGRPTPPSPAQQQQINTLQQRIDSLQKDKPTMPKPGSTMEHAPTGAPTPPPRLTQAPTQSPPSPQPGSNSMVDKLRDRGTVFSQPGQPGQQEPPTSS